VCPDFDHSLIYVAWQAAFRGYKGRKIAETKARVQAFRKALQTTLQKVRDKVRNEVLSKEKLTGLEKLKYDAKLRNRGAKMRAAGLPADREDVLAAMIKEGIEAGEREVKFRFKEIAREKGLLPYLEDLEDGLKKEQEAAVDIRQSLAVVSEKTADILKEHEEIVQEREAERPENFINLPGVEDRLSEEMLQERRMAIIKGQRPTELFKAGETESEMQLRFRFLLSDVSRPELYKRLRALEEVVTEMKAIELMLELPSKRLIMTFLENCNKYHLAEELRDHFRIVRSSGVLAEVMRDVMCSDLEYGVIKRAARSLYVGQHGALEHQFLNEIEKGLKKAHETISKAGKSAAMATLSMDEKIDRLSEKSLIQLKKKQNIIDSASATLEKVNKKIYGARMAVDELGRRLLDLERYRISKVKRDPLLEAIPVSQRIQWWKRYAAALEASEATPTLVRDKYQEISNVAHEFLHLANRIACTIINELYLPLDKKTIRPIAQTSADCRAKEGGRGINGMRYKYESWGIRFKVLLDDHGIFNGSDECCAKMGGAERRNSLECQKLYVKGLGVPLTTTIDYHGFRVLAVAKMPTEVIRYSDTGDIRSRKEEFVFGTRDRGETFMDADRKLTWLLETMSKKLNLCRHSIQAFKDLNPKQIWASADLRGYKGEDGVYCLLNFWRMMPPEFPNFAAHLTSAPRDMSIFWRFLRPELVRLYPEPLSADADLLLTRDTVDWYPNSKTVMQATSQLLRMTVRKFADYLSKQPTTVPAWQGYGIDLTANMHRYGINMRHLGLLRAMFWRKLGGTVNVAFNARKFITHTDLRPEVSRGMKLKVRGIYYRISTNPKDEFSERAIGVEEKITDISRNYEDIYAGEVEDETNSEQIRLLLLAEIVARTTKNVMRSYLRMTLKTMFTSTEYMQVAVIVDFLNILTGSHPNTSEFWAEQIYHAAIQRYGLFAMTLVERPNLRFVLSPMVIYLVQRLQEMMGFSLTQECLANFHRSPRCFRFTPRDVVTPVVRVKHNVPILAFADAVLLNNQADAISTKTYSDHVLSDMPLLYWKFCERRGSRLAYNYGTLKGSASGQYSNTVTFEAEGPIANEEINRAIRIRSDDKAKIDCAFVPELAPTSSAQHFSVEVWAKVSGGWDTHRVVLMNNRYCLVANRENKWVFQVMAKYVTAALIGPEILRDQWSHIVCTYDGTWVRMYVNSMYMTGFELSEELEHQLELVRNQRREEYDRIDEEERRAKDSCWADTEEAAKKYFKSKDGRAMLRKATQKLLEQAAFKAKIQEAKNNEEETDEPREAPKVLTKDQAAEVAKQNYKVENYAVNVQAISVNFKRIREETMDRHRRQDTEAALKLTTTLRVGGTGPNKATNVGMYFFEGDLCHLSIYDVELSPDRVQAHYLSGTQERSLESERLYQLAADKFQEALMFAPNDPTILARYALTVCNFVQTSGTRQLNERRTKNKVAHALEIFRSLENYDAMAELLRRLPGEFVFSGTCCDIFNTIISNRPAYFYGDYFTHKDLANVPNRFLLYESDEPYHIQTAAKIYQTVMEDASRALFYGDDDLTFLTKIKNPKVILTLVKHVQSGADKRIVDFNIYRDCTDLEDDDLEVVADYRRAALVMNVKGCSRLTDKSIKLVARYCTGLNALTLDGCSQVTNHCLTSIGNYCKKLHLLSIEKCVRITNEGLIGLLTACPQLKILNLGQCAQFNDIVLHEIALKCKELELLHIPYCYQISDEGMMNFTLNLHRNANLTSLDLTACKGLNDDGYELVGRACGSLTYLNLSSARITDIGMKAVTHGCWKLRTLILEDLYLISDEVFYFDVVGDGRRQADENMLTSLTELNINDCTRLTDKALAAISSRSASLSILKMTGCSHMTDAGLSYLITEPRYNQARGKNLSKLYFSYCIQLTNQGVMDLCHACDKMVVLELSGCVHLTDEALLIIAQYCPLLQTIHVARCKRLTDRALCSLADYLWVEDLDVAHCNRLTDEGVEVIALECGGMRRLNVAYCYRLTDRCLRVVANHCKVLQYLQVSNCSNLTREIIEEVQKELPKCHILHSSASGDTSIGSRSVVSTAASTSVATTTTLTEGSSDSTTASTSI